MHRNARGLTEGNAPAAVKRVVESGLLLDKTSGSSCGAMFAVPTLACALLPPEHGGAYDDNYGPISLSFLAQAHRVSGATMFAEDGDALARYLDARLTSGGYDNGGPRHSEQHSGFESVLGLRYFGARIGSDLGRYRGDTRWGRHAVQRDGRIDGHFAFMLVWQIQDRTR